MPQLEAPEIGWHDRFPNDKLPHDFVKVQLNWEEVKVGADIGVLRGMYSAQKNLRAAAGAEKRCFWDHNIDGAVGEVAFAKAIGWYFPASVNTFKSEPDVHGCEVRTGSRHNYCLNIRLDDVRNKKFGIYVHVTGSIPHYHNFDFRIHGWWRFAADTLREEWLTNCYGNGGPPCYWVPMAELQPIELLFAEPECSPPKGLYA